MVDHFNYDTTSAVDKHDVLLVPRPGAPRDDVMNFFGGDGLLALPNTVSQTLGNTSPLLAPILKAPATAYAYNPKEEGESVEDVSATGSQLSLISAMQARNSARFVVLGSLDMLQDKWFSASVKGKDGKSTKTVNRDFAKQLTEWTFKEVGVLKVGNIQHHLVEDASKPADNTTQLGFLNPQIYRIKNDVVRPPNLLPWLLLMLCTRTSPSLFLFTTAHTTFPIPSLLATLCSSNSACSLPSNAYHYHPFPQLQTQPRTPPHSQRQTSTESSCSKSITNAHSSPASRRRDKSQSDISLTMSGRGVS